MSTLTRAAEKLRSDPLHLAAELSNLLALIDDYPCPPVVVEAAERVAAEALADPGDVPGAAFSEKVCGDCGGHNPTWHAPNPLWNRVMGGPEGVVCPSCFTVRAEGLGMVPTAWAVIPEMPSRRWTARYDPDPEAPAGAS